ncbi:hypothetical protein BD309DRAFT_212335 [Dichomitus squalens]|nr:hypothetical protein BD309DRAFT_212335 [Dichomitus squalens]
MRLPAQARQASALCHVFLLRRPPSVSARAFTPRHIRVSGRVLCNYLIYGSLECVRLPSRGLGLGGQASPTRGGGPDGKSAAFSISPPRSPAVQPGAGLRLCQGRSGRAPPCVQAGPTTSEMCLSTSRSEEVAMPEVRRDRAVVSMQLAELHEGVRNLEPP